MYRLTTQVEKFHQVISVAPWFYLLYGTIGGSIAVIGLVLRTLRRPE